MINVNEEVRALAAFCGISEDEARQRLADDDLWLLPAESRYVLDAAAWRFAASTLEALANAFDEATRQCLLDAAIRASEAAARAS